MFKLNFQQSPIICAQAKVSAFPNWVNILSLCIEWERGLRVGTNKHRQAAPANDA